MKKVLLLIPLILFVLALFAVGRNLRKPFVGIHDWNGARYGNIARNYLRYSFFTTYFGQVENSGEVASKNFQYYTHYPPLLPVLISISYRIFGISEFATRLIPLLATVGTIVTLYLISRTIFNWEIGIMAGLLVLATPMIRYFGKNPVHEPLALFFALISFLGATYVLEKRKGGWVLVFLGLILISLTNWSGVFLALGLTIILWSKVPRNQIVKIWLSLVLVIVLHFIHIYILTGTLTGGGIFEAFLQRSALGGEAILTKFTFWEFVNTLRIWASTLFTITLIITAAFGLYFLVKKGNKSQKVFILALFVYGLGYPLSFPNATFIHSYFIFAVVPALGLLASFAIYSIPKKEAFRIILFLIIFMLIWFERRPYFLALERSQGDILAYQIGRELANKTSKDAVVLIEPYDYGASRFPILSFYSDRKITLERKREYNWIVKVDEATDSYETFSNNNHPK